MRAEVGGIADDAGRDAGRAARATVPCSAAMRSVACRPGSSEFTVTPSPATSRASVRRKPVSPARAVFDRIRFGIGWRTAIDVIATTRPHLPFAHLGHRLVTHRDRAVAVQLERVEVLVDGRVREVARRADRPRCSTRMSMPPSAARASRTKPVAPSTVRDVGDDRHRVAADAAAAAVDRVAVAAADRDRARPSAASACATPKPSPFDAAATAARFPAIPRSTGLLACDPSVAQWMGPAVSRSDCAPPPGAQRDDLGADRDRGLLGRARADVETDRRHHPGDLGVGQPGVAQPLRALLVRAPRSHRAEVADPRLDRARDRGHVELVVVGEHADRVAGPRSSPTFAR